MKLFLALFLILPLSGCGYVPLGVGHRMKVCGTVVDENLNKILDTIIISATADYPLINLQGNTYEKEWTKTVTDGRFCLDAYFAISLTAFISGKHIRGKYISVMDTSVNVQDFKWAVEREPKMGPRPNLSSEIDFIASDTGAQRGYSIISNRLVFHDKNELDVLIDPFNVRSLNEMDGIYIGEANDTAQLESWLSRHPGTIKKEPGEKIQNTWKFVRSKIGLDYYMIQKNDSLYFVPGPIAKTKFIPASLDSPVCNFGRLPGPPSVSDPRWRDTMLVAIKDVPVIDAYYVHFPWRKRWGKVILNPKIERNSTQVKVTVSQLLKDMSDTSTFYFWRVHDRAFTERQKCLTKVEAYRKTKEYRGFWYDHRRITPGED
jgi:hypothetical protein